MNALSRLVALALMVGLSSSVTAAPVDRNSGGCAKLITALDSNGYTTYLQSFQSDCATWQPRDCRPYDSLSSMNDFTVATYFLHQDATGAWSGCLGEEDPYGNHALVGLGTHHCIPGNQTTYEVDQWYIGFSAAPGFLSANGCGPGWYKTYAEGRIQTSAGVLYVTAESSPMWADPPPDPPCCDDANACTLDNCRADGTCGHVYNPACVVPMLTTLLEDNCGNGTLDPGEQCDDGNTADRDCCSSVCAFEAAGSKCGGGCEARECDRAGVCRVP